METKPRILPSILYGIAGLAVLLLSTKDPISLLLICLITSALWLASACLWEAAVYPALGLGVVILIWRVDLLYALIAIAVIAALVFSIRDRVQDGQPLAVTVGVPALVAAVAAVAVLVVYLYITRGAFDFSGLMPSLSQIKTALDEALYDPLLTAAQATQMTPEEIDQSISAVLTAKNVYLDAMFTVLPGFLMSVLFIVSWAVQRLAKLLLGKKYADRLAVRPIGTLSLPVGVGAVFLLAFLLSFFVEGTVGAVLNNLVTAFEIPLLLCGCFTVYAFFTRNVPSRGSKALTALLVTLTAIGIPVSLGIVYVFIGIADSMADLRRRIRGEEAQSEPNERMKQWTSFQEMKPGNDAEASEELDVPEDDDDDENEGEDQ